MLLHMWVSGWFLVALARPSNFWASKVVVGDRSSEEPDPVVLPAINRTIRPSSPSVTKSVSWKVRPPPLPSDTLYEKMVFAATLYLMTTICAGDSDRLTRCWIYHQSAVRLLQVEREVDVMFLSKMTEEVGSWKLSSPAILNSDVPYPWRSSDHRFGVKLTGQFSSGRHRQTRGVI